jgi:glucoamylase
MLGSLHRLWGNVVRWFRHLRAPASGPTPHTKDRGERVASRARFWAELPEEQRERDPETFLPLPSYDLWEERHGVHTYTAASVVAGLRGAARFARLFHDAARAETYETAAGQMVVGIETHLYHRALRRYARSGYRTEAGYQLDEVIDISLLGLATLGALPLKDPRIVGTVEAVSRELSVETAVGGVARYQGDRYQWAEDVPADVPGNPWFIATLWLGEYLIERAESVAELRDALPHLEWCARNALPSGVLAEQVHPVTGAPLSVSPLTWSHSAFVRVVLQYVEKREALGERAPESRRRPQLEADQRRPGRLLRPRPA